MENAKRTTQVSSNIGRGCEHCGYGVGAMVDLEDAPKGFGAHSDQERILEEAVYKHMQFFWTAVTSIAGSKH